MMHPLAVLACGLFAGTALAQSIPASASQADLATVVGEYDNSGFDTPVSALYRFSPRSARNESNV